MKLFIIILLSLFAISCSENDTSVNNTNTDITNENTTELEGTWQRIKNETDEYPDILPIARLKFTGNKFTSNLLWTDGDVSSMSGGTFTLSGDSLIMMFEYIYERMGDNEYEYRSASDYSDEESRDSSYIQIKENSFSLDKNSNEFLRTDVEVLAEPK